MTAVDGGSRAALLRRRRLAWWILVVLAIAARVAWAAWVAHAHPEAVRSGDTPQYLGPARALLDSGHFTLSPEDPTPMFLRTPGYPVLLAAILWVTDSVWSISPIQAASSALVVAATVLVGRRLAGVTAGLLAGAIVAFDPLQFALSGTILAEALTSFLLVCVVAAAVLAFARPPRDVRARHVLLLGTLLAFATMVRPTTYFFPLVAAVLLAVRYRRLTPRTIAVLLVALLLPSIVIVGGWQVRNHRTLDSWAVSASPGVTLYCYQGAEVEGLARGIGTRAARIELGCHPGGWDDLREHCPEWWPCDDPQRVAYGPGYDEMSRRGARIMLDHPVESAEVLVKGFGRGVLGPGSDTVGRFLHLDGSGILAGPLFLWNLALWTLATVGAVVGLRSRQRAAWAFVAALILYVLVVSSGAETGARFRTPLVPLLALFAALGARHLAQAWGARRAVRAGSTPG